MNTQASTHGAATAGYGNDIAALAYGRASHNEFDIELDENSDFSSDVGSDVQLKARQTVQTSSQKV
jgi:hypothetical protein